MNNSVTDAIEHLAVSSSLFAEFLKGQVMIVIEPHQEGEKNIPGCIWRGQLADIVVIKDGAGVELDLEWAAKNPEYPDSKKWILDPEKKGHAIDSKNGYFVKVNSVESGPANKPLSNSNNELLFTGRCPSEIVIFFPKDGDKLDPKKVEGLKSTG